jgi:hypothetical protein
MESATVNALTAARTRAWYEGMPQNYAQYADIRNLGAAFSYSYDITSGPLRDMRQSCGRPSRRLTAQQLNVTAATKEFTAVGYDREKIWQAKMMALCHAQGLSTEETRLQVERIVTLLYANCFPGEVKDYPVAFKQMMNFHGKARAVQVLDDLKSGRSRIVLKTEEWTAINFDTYGCRGDVHVVD